MIERYNRLRDGLAQFIENAQRGIQPRKRFEAGLLKMELWTKTTSDVLAVPVDLGSSLPQLENVVKKYQVCFSVPQKCEIRLSFVHRTCTGKTVENKLEKMLI